MDAELVFDGNGPQVVLLTRGPVLLGATAGHDEEGEPPGPLRRVGGAGEHHVHDVLGKIVLPPGNEDLLTAQTEAAGSARGLGERAGGSEVASGLGLGEVHGPRPAAAHHRLRVERFLFGRSESEQKFDRPLGQKRAERKGHVRRLPHLLEDGAQELGQAHAVVLGGERDTVPTPRHEIGVDVLEGGRGEHPRRGQAGPLRIAVAVRGGQAFLRESGPLLENGVDGPGVDRPLRGQAWDLTQPKDIVEEETVFR